MLSFAFEMCVCVCVQPILPFVDSASAYLLLTKIYLWRFVGTCGHVKSSENLNHMTWSSPAEVQKDNPLHSVNKDPF